MRTLTLFYRKTGRGDEQLKLALEWRRLLKSLKVAYTSFNISTQRVGLYHDLYDHGEIGHDMPVLMAKGGEWGIAFYKRFNNQKLPSWLFDQGLLAGKPREVLPLSFDEIRSPANLGILSGAEELC